MSDRVLTSGDIPLRTKVPSEEFYAELDPGIRFACRVLHSRGIETCQSCEGGDGHAYPVPTVDLLAGPNDMAGLIALGYLHAFGLDVRSVSKHWSVKNGEPFEMLWRIEFARAYPERADEPLMFLWGYQAQPDTAPVEHVVTEWARPMRPNPSRAYEGAGGDVWIGAPELAKRLMKLGRTHTPSAVAEAAAFLADGTFSTWAPSEDSVARIYALRDAILERWAEIEKQIGSASDDRPAWREAWAESAAIVALSAHPL